ncbi:DNA cytosine methyltransferase, partial [bacterium]
QYTGPFSWENRPFTVREFKRLQTFPDDYQLSGTRQRAIQQIGNSVPPQLARVLAMSILDQVFGAPMPCEITYLEDGEQLGFRRRKRQMTRYYQAAAKEAIAELVAAGVVGRELEKGHHDEQVSRVLGEDFGWRDRGSGIAVKVHSSIANDEWTLVAHQVGSTVVKPKWTVEVRPATPDSWVLGVATVHLSGMDWSPATFTAVWKEFEDLVRRRTGTADLVQLSGYYQYPAQLSCSMELLSEDFPVPEWRWVPKIVGGQAVAETLTLEEAAFAWEASLDEARALFTFARLLGYEARSHSTNPQLRPGCHLLPYAFPTLTPQSVQLRKRFTA